MASCSTALMSLQPAEWLLSLPSLLLLVSQLVSHLAAIDTSAQSIQSKLISILGRLIAHTRAY